MKNRRHLTYARAIRESLEQSMARDKTVIVIGEGVPDPKGIFGTTLGLREKYGKSRVFDMPVSENGMTGILIGAAISGLKPVMVHQRIDFTLLAFDQIVNNAAKWHYMFGGGTHVPLVIRMLIGRGWGQGAQHSQSLQALYGHVAGLKVVMPATPIDAKGMLNSAIRCTDPVIFIEHRWLHDTIGYVPRKYFFTRLDKANILKNGKDVTIVTTSYMTVEGLRAEELLQKAGISIELIDARSIKPFDSATVIRSVRKTGRLVVADTGHRTLGFASEVISNVSESNAMGWRSPPKKIALPDIPTPTGWAAAEKYYPTYIDIVTTVLNMLKFPKDQINQLIKDNVLPTKIRSDVPDVSFRGPF